MVGNETVIESGSVSDTVGSLMRARLDVSGSETCSFDTSGLGSMYEDSVWALLSAYYGGGGGEGTGNVRGESTPSPFHIPVTANTNWGRNEGEIEFPEMSK